LVAQHSRKEPQIEPNWSQGAAFAPEESVAEILRRTRKERGENLRKIAENLRVRLAYLQALEEVDHDRLPGTAYALGFLRSYAEHLGLDSFEIVERYKAEQQGSKTHADLVFPEPVTDGRVPGGAIILISALLLALVYGGWTYFTSRETNVGDLVPELPERLQGLIASEPEAGPAPLPPSGAVTYAPPTAFGEPMSGQSTGSGPVATQVPDTAPTVATVPAEATDSPSASAVGVPAEPLSSPMAAPSSDLPTSPREAASERLEPAIAAEVAPLAVPTAPAIPTGPTSTPRAPAEPSAPIEETVGPSPQETAEPARIEAASVTPERPLPEPVADVPEAATVEAAPDDTFVEETVVIPAPPTSAPEVASLPGDAVPRTYGQTSEPSRIVLRATQDSWVQVRNAQDALLLTRVLRAGDTYQVPDRPGLTLLTGNAGGIEIEVDGVTLPALGPVGAVRRQVELDPERLVETLALPE